MRVCLSMWVGFLFRVLGVVGGGECSGVSLKGGWVCSAWCGRVRVAVWGVVRVGMRLVMYVSNSPVRRYFRWDLARSSAFCWVCERVGMLPWYIVVRFIRRMCRPHVKPSVCWGVLWLGISGSLVRRRRAANVKPGF